MIDELAAGQWARLPPLLPRERLSRGRLAKDRRTVVDAILPIRAPGTGRATASCVRAVQIHWSRHLIDVSSTRVHQNAAALEKVAEKARRLVEVEGPRREANRFAKHALVRS